MNGILHCVPTLPNWLLSRPFNQIFAFYTKLTPFKTIQPDFCIVYPIDSFQDIWPNFINVLCAYFYQCVTNWLFSIPYDLIFALFTQMTPFKTIWPNFINVYPIDSLQDHMTWFLHCVPVFINVYPIGSFQYHMSWFLHCVHNWLLSRPSDLIWLLSRPFDLILSMCT